MKLDNILKKLEQEKAIITKGCFLDNEVYFANGTALVDIVDGKVKPTNAKWIEVVEQIVNNRSHIQDVIGKKKELSRNYKLGN